MCSLGSGVYPAPTSSPMSIVHDAAPSALSGSRSMFFTSSMCGSAKVGRQFDWFCQTSRHRPVLPAAAGLVGSRRQRVGDGDGLCSLRLR
jgi:hypothetical protein